MIEYIEQAKQQIEKIATSQYENILSAAQLCANCDY